MVCVQRPGRWHMSSRAYFTYLKFSQPFTEKIASGWNVGILLNSKVTITDIIIHQVPSTLLALCIIFLIDASSYIFS